MPRFVAFLRAINVGGHVVKMDELRRLFESLGFTGVIFLFPFFFQSRKAAQPVPWATAALAPVLHFPLIHEIVQNAWPEFWHSAGGIVPADLPIAKVLSLHDSWTLRCSEMLKCARSRREKLYYKLLSYDEPRYERLVYPRFERCTVVADPDAQAVRKTVPDARVDLIPYGTDTDYFHPVAVEKEPATLVFHSHLGYTPNIDAALEFANDIFPLVRQRVPEARLHLIGASPDAKVLALATLCGAGTLLTRAIYSDTTTGIRRAEDDIKQF